MRAMAACQITRVALQLDGSKEAGEQRGEQLGYGRHARSPVKGLTWKASLDREDGAA